MIGNAAKCHDRSDIYGFPIPSEETAKFSLPGGRLNKKDGLTRYGDSHVKDKTS